MRDDIDFLVAFIKEVEDNPMLYDVQDRGYSNLAVTDRIWSQIGGKFNESALDCKTKWRNIRSAYIRNLNTRSKRESGAGPRTRPYYLAQHLLFLNPFTKPRRQDVASEATESPEERPQPAEEYEEEESNGAELPVEIFIEDSGDAFDSTEQKPAENIPADASDLEKSAVEYFSAKRRRMSEAEAFSQRDSCELFLLSLAPKMRSMTERQQLSFQIGVLNLIEKIKFHNSQSFM